MSRTRTTPWYLSVPLVDVLANPSVQRWLLIGLAVIGAAGVVTLFGVLWAARRPMPHRARVLRRRVGAVALFVIVAAGAAFALLATPVETETSASPPPTAPAPGEGEAELVSTGRFSSAELPALSMTAPDGWRLAFDKAGRKLTATSETARLLVSTAILREAVDVDTLIRHMADRQQALGLEVSATFSDRLGDLPATGFLSTGPARSVCTWMVKRDTHVASSLICTTEGKRTAREACRGPLATLRWRAPQR
jgi:hypothetical protein